MKKRPDKKIKQALKWLYFIIFLCIVIWLVFSIIKKRNPLEMIQSGFPKLTTSEDSSLTILLAEKDSIIQELQNKLAVYEGTNLNKRAIVIIESEYLNMRSGPSLTTSILARIPANAEVTLMYYDSNTFYIDNEAGRWARIIYGDVEGWVWGNLIREI